MDMPNLDAPNLESLQSLQPAAIVSQVQGGGIRLNALKEIAIGLGVKGGLNHRSQEINKKLELQKSRLDAIYNFASLIISSPAGMSKTAQYAILPPVISEANSTLKAVGDDEIQAADKVYRIESQAKFVTAAPTWRIYLTQPSQPVELPDATLLPRDDNERKAWKQWIAEGWGVGIKQADAIFDVSLSKLTRDYNGMVKYKTLLTQKIVTEPFVAENRLGVTGGGSDLSIDSRILKITAHPSLNVQYHEWKPTVYAR
ncbi:MAG: type IV secretion system protein DotC [Methylotenera sp.]|uniref:type IV secretory system conjugative DNA transfer family protein n=1 Tax=Methylotenera sp. TaxID=2051956 RepID=UPI000D465370|nr:type IV secretory system conjugative DNA transfer family protein [Methylotenera sp.]PPC84780.1 MAG: type IV secretion system protein DotC [Methylotenera sp.]PPD02139.1 MAG: type IV secretion system protein DotC [Methylotenera sp.]